MQSWGTTSRFDQRDTGKEPSKSGILGILAAALGIDRNNWRDLEPLTHLSMAVRHDRPGILKYDYQTAGCGKGNGIVKANGKLANEEGVVSKRSYLADATFLVALEGDCLLLHKTQRALQNPVWPLFLGRKSYVPSEPVWLPEGVIEENWRKVLETWPWLASLRFKEKEPEKLLLSWESSSSEGVLKMDQLLSSFEERRFGARFVLSQYIAFPKEVVHVSP
jgi:CRISPR system Cascade subunit CasD